MNDLICIGVDEVGRGCLAGPIAACAFVFHDGISNIAGLKDSKKMTALAREKMEKVLLDAGHHGYAEVSCTEIDEIGIDAANFLAMRRAIENIGLVDLSRFHLIVDGDKVPPLHDLGIGRVECIAKADDKFPCVSAASVLAKVRRDRLMSIAAETYPEYGFNTNAGYGSKMHTTAIEEHGPCPLHRMSFAPMNKKTVKKVAGMRP